MGIVEGFLFYPSKFRQPQWPYNPNIQICGCSYFSLNRSVANEYKTMKKLPSLDIFMNMLFRCHYAVRGEIAWRQALFEKFITKHSSFDLVPANC